MIFAIGYTKFANRRCFSRRKTIISFQPSRRHATWRSGVPSSVMRILRGHGHICLIAPDLDLAQILHEWRRGLESSMNGLF